MSSPLQELCSLVADTGLIKAEKLTSQFEQILSEEPEVSLDTKSHETILLAFVFMNSALATGVWSNLDNTKLRRDMMGELRKMLVLKTALKLSASQEPADVAFLAASIDQQFQAFWRDYIDNINQLEASGTSADARAALTFGLIWIQERLKITDKVLCRIMPSFLAEAVDLAEVEDVAAQVNRAADMRKRKGFLSRLFGR